MADLVAYTEEILSRKRLFVQRTLMLLDQDDARYLSTKIKHGKNESKLYKIKPKVGIIAIVSFLFLPQMI